MGCKYRRVLLKISGESLMGTKSFGHDIDFMKILANGIKKIIDHGTELCIVVGGGNICRGINASVYGIDRVEADQIGMLGTVINALVMRGVQEDNGISTRVMSSFAVSGICDTYMKSKAERHLKKGRVVIFAGGTGNPFFTTDTAAVLRGIEMKCDIVIKATQVDGVYSSDPKINKDAQRYQAISYQDVITKKLNIMDMPAIALAQENNLPLIVCAINEPEELFHIISGNEAKFTKIQN